MKDLEKILKALANKRRLAIVKFLKENREASVGEIADRIKLSFKSTSRHLAILSSADIIEKEQRSTSAFYRLSLEQKYVIKQIISAL